MASMGGFKKPILHGLCFYGISCRVVADLFCDSNSDLLTSIQARFTGSVYPGEKIDYTFWRD